jgi:hypothetical protein
VQKAVEARNGLRNLAMPIQHRTHVQVTGAAGGDFSKRTEAASATNRRPALSESQQQHSLNKYTCGLHRLGGAIERIQSLHISTVLVSATVAFPPFIEKAVI